MRKTALAAAVAIAAGNAAIAQAQTQRLAVPAFFPLSTNGVVNGDWKRLQQAGSIARIVVAELDTIGTGVPGTGCTSSPAEMFDCLRANGQLVLGYVYTASAQRLLENVLHGGDGMVSVDQWYAAFGGHLDGIFFDVGPDLAAPVLESVQREYYTSLYQTLTTPGSPDHRAGPCGSHACIMVNASQFPNDWVMSVTDYAVLWERALHGADMVTCNQANGQDYLDAARFCPADGITPNPNCATVQSPPGWYFSPSTAPRAAHVIYGVHSAADVPRIISQSRSAYGSPGFLFMHDQDCDLTHGAVYSRLPPYFEQVVAALAGSTTIVLPVTRPDGTVVAVPIEL